MEGIMVKGQQKTAITAEEMAALLVDRMKAEIDQQRNPLVPEHGEEAAHRFNALGNIADDLGITHLVSPHTVAYFRNG